MAKRNYKEGLQCPWCGFIGHFIHLKTIRFKGKVMRGWECPKCKDDFVSTEISLKENFRKRTAVKRVTHGR